MIAGHETDVRGVAERLHPSRRAAEFSRHADIDEIACHRDVVGALLPQILDEAREQSHVVQPLAAALPVDVAHEALEAEVGEAGEGRRTKMRVCDMRDREAHARPGSYGAAPPFTGCNKGASMEIQPGPRR